MPLRYARCLFAAAVTLFRHAYFQQKRNKVTEYTSQQVAASAAAAADAAPPLFRYGATAAIDFHDATRIRRACQLLRYAVTRFSCQHFAIHADDAATLLAAALNDADATPCYRCRDIVLPMLRYAAMPP